MNLLPILAKELIEKSKAATPGPWRTWTSGNPAKAYTLKDLNVESLERCESGIPPQICKTSSAKYGEADADYIAACSPQDIQRLAEAYLAAVEAMNLIDLVVHTQSDPVAVESSRKAALLWLARYGEVK